MSVAKAGGGEVRYVGEIANTPKAMVKCAVRAGGGSLDVSACGTQDSDLAATCRTHAGGDSGHRLKRAEAVVPDIVKCGIGDMIAIAAPRQPKLGAGSETHCLSRKAEGKIDTRRIVVALPGLHIGSFERGFNSPAPTQHRGYASDRQQAVAPAMPYWHWPLPPLPPHRPRRSAGTG